MSAQPVSPFTAAAGPPALAGDAVTLLDGSCFCLSDPRGDVHPHQPAGLFVHDTRVLSRWQLTVDGQGLALLGVQHAEPFAATFISRVPPPAGRADSPITVVRRRYVGEGLREDVTLCNCVGWPVEATIDLAVDSDLADLFEVKDGRCGEPRPVVRMWRDGALWILRDHCGTQVHADRPPTLTQEGLRWRANIPPRGEWTVTLQVAAVVDDVVRPVRHPPGGAIEHAAPARGQREWREQSPQVESPDADLAAILRRSVEDLGALRIFDPAHPDRPVVAAGAPWFMALFGRDALLTSWMALPLHSGLALGTLQTLAEHQGQAVDDTSEEEPGRILHEVRLGPANTSTDGARHIYYGTADATPLFVMLLGELHRWDKDGNALRILLPYADRALRWIDDFGDVDGDGFVEYERKTERGLVNQGWKDSWDGINFADGSIARAPIALAEVQGYTYAAYLARAELAQALDDSAAAAHWASRADALRAAFNEAFWLPDRGWYAVGLDRDKRPIDALTSNIGHCLWTGIVEPDKAERMAEHLTSEHLFSGWGVRTLATTMGAYNPISYHNGSVWPHDTAICVAGLTRYGLRAQASRIAQGLLGAARHFGGRLPELFCGFDRSQFAAPVPYPTSCSPQAWAAAAPLLVLRSLLGLEPDLGRGELWCAPDLPEHLLPLALRGVRLGDAYVDVVVERAGWHVAGLDGRALRLMRGIRPS